MLTRKCDICGAEMRMTTPRYKVIFDGWLYTKEKDICIDCFERITDEIRQAEPTISKMEQVDKDINVRSKNEPQTKGSERLLKGSERLLKGKDEPQTDYTPDCPFCVRYGTDECLRDKCRHYQTYKDEPQTCSVSGRPYSECSDCEYFKCTADEPQKIMEKCYSCKWWYYSYGCSNKKGICEFEPLKDEQSGKE